MAWQPSRRHGPAALWMALSMHGCRGTKQPSSALFAASTTVSAARRVMSPLPQRGVTRRRVAGVRDLMGNGRQVGRLGDGTRQTFSAEQRVQDHASVVQV